MEKTNFISKEQVKKLVEDEYFYGINIPMQFYTKDTESGIYILQANTAEFQDFLEKVREEVYYQDYFDGDEGEYALEDIICDFKLDTSGLGKLTFTTYDEYLDERGESEKTIHIVRVYLPQPLKNKGKDDYELQDFIKRMTNAVAYSGYAKNTDTATVSWKLTEDEYGEKVIEFEVVEKE